jgi:hypothetical protein
MDIKQRLGHDLDRHTLTLLSGDELRQLRRDALAEIETLESNLSNYDIPRETENIVRIMVALIGVGHDADLAARRAIEAYASLKHDLKIASNR